MNKKKVLALVLGAALTAGVAFNYATTANYREKLGTATQVLNAASWDVELGNGLKSHVIFPGDVVGEDTITLKNNNDYAVRFEIKLTTKDKGLHQALTLELLNGNEGTGIPKSGGYGIAIIEVAPKSQKVLTSKVAWEPKDDETNLTFNGKSVEYNYDVTAAAALEGGRPVYLSNFEDESSLAGWHLNGSPEGSLTFVEGKGMQVKGGVFTRFDGYRTEGVTNFTNITVIDVSGLENLEGFDYSVAANGKDGNHKQDYIFHIYRDGAGEININADNNSSHKVPSNIVANADTIKTTDNKLTLIQDFYPENGEFKSNMMVKDSQGNEVFKKVITSRYGAEVIGGNRYGWFLAMGKNESGKEAAGLNNGIIVKSSKLEVKPQVKALASNLTVSGWGSTHIQLDFDLAKELDLTFKKSFTDITIDYYHAGGIYQKNKGWSGYLNLNNDTSQKYPNGALDTEGYKNVLPAGRYGTAVNSGTKMDVSTVNKIVVTVTDENGYKTVLEAIR